MKSELANELVRKLKDSDGYDMGVSNGRMSVAISRYMNEGKDTKNTLTTKASKYASSRHFGGNSLMNRYEYN
jgi:cysteine synthase